MPWHYIIFIHIKIIHATDSAADDPNSSMYYLSISVRVSRVARCQIDVGPRRTKLKTVARWRWRQHTSCNYRRAAAVKLCAMLNASIISVVIVIMRYCVSLILRREWHNNNKWWADNILVFRPCSRKLRPLLPRGRWSYAPAIIR